MGARIFGPASLMFLCACGSMPGTPSASLTPYPSPSPGPPSVTPPPSTPPAGDSNNLTGLPTVTYADFNNTLGMTVNDQPALADGGAPYGYAYQPPEAGALLYGPSGMPRAVDVKQGYLGDCYFMAGLSGTADRFTQFVHDGIRYVGLNADGSHNYAVRLYAESPPASQRFVQQWVPVDDRMFRQPNNTIMAAQGNILWPAVVEKAMAKLNSVTHQVGSPNDSGYQTLNTGGNYEGYEAITGIAAQTSYTVSKPSPDLHPTASTMKQLLPSTDGGGMLLSTGFIDATMLQALAGYDANTRSLTLASGSKLTAQDDDTVMYAATNGTQLTLIPGHVFAILGANQGRVLVRNPWGTNPSDVGGANGEFWMSEDDFMQVSTLSYVLPTAGSAVGSASGAHTFPQL